MNGGNSNVIVAHPKKVTNDYVQMLQSEYKQRVTGSNDKSSSDLQTSSSTTDVVKPSPTVVEPKQPVPALFRSYSSKNEPPVEYECQRCQKPASGIDRVNILGENYHKYYQALAMLMAHL